MGDGGVACMPSQHIIMDHLCGGQNGNFKFAERKMKLKMKNMKREELLKKGKSSKKVEKTEKLPNEEVEEGELGSLKWPEKGRKFGIKSEIDKLGKWEDEKGEKFSARWTKGDMNIEKGEFSSWRVPKDEVERGEFIPERWRKSEVVMDDKKRRNRELPFGKHSQYLGEKEVSRRSSRNQWPSSKVIDEEVSSRNEFNSNGKNHGREYPLGNRLKRQGADSDKIDSRHNYGEFGHYNNSKTRRISDDGNRYPDHFSRLPMERSHRKSFPSRKIPFERYSYKHPETSQSSRIVYDRYNSSPRHPERSPCERARYHDHRDRSPVRRNRSPYDRNRHYDDHRNRSPSYSERSPQARFHDRRDRTPNFLERSPVNRGRSINHRDNQQEISRKNGANSKRQSNHGNQLLGEKQNQRCPKRKNSQSPSKESEDKSNLDDGKVLIEGDENNQLHKEEMSPSPSLNCKESPQDQVNGTTEELLSMEEDMDICDTPPPTPQHVPVVADLKTGKWSYLDHFGVEQGPFKLCDLKNLTEEGFLVSDHFIKHLDNERWVTLENAVSPSVTANFPSIVSDTVTQLVSPPEAPGNLLTDFGDDGKSSDQIVDEMLDSFSEPIEEGLAGLETFHIDERVGALLEGFTIIPGRELETVGEVLQWTFEDGNWERCGNFQGFICHGSLTGEHNVRKGDELTSFPEFSSKESLESRSTAPTLSDKDNAIACDNTSGWFFGNWSCKGGDWKRNDEDAQDTFSRKKLVLNDGYPLCQMPKSGYEDPRWHRKDELYCPSHSKRLDLPPWAFSSPDDWIDCNGTGKSSQTKASVLKGVKGTMLPVIRINTCVVKDHGSFISEPRTKVRGKERYSSSRSNRPNNATSDKKRSSEEGVSCSKSLREQDSHGSWKNITSSISIPNDCLCTADDLQLHLGDWYYLDGVGHEQGPLLFPELQVLADQGIIQNNTSVFRKFDKVWVPVTSSAEASESVRKIQGENNASSSETLSLSGTSSRFSSFHSLHPQFIGYARGKLHELVMKSYRSREFAAAINEVLDPWINARQPRNEIEKAVNNKFQRSDQFRAGKRARLLVDLSEEDYEMDEEISTVQKDECLFDDLCSDATFCNEDNPGSESETGNWGLLDGLVLARVFHFLRADIKSLVYAALTCKHWRYVIKFYKDISTQADLSSVAPSCTDSMIWNIVNGYNKEKITSLVVHGCTNVTVCTLEEIIRLFPCLLSIDIRGCSQFEDLTCKFPNVRWVKNRGSHSKIKSLKHKTERTSSVFKTYSGLDSQTDDSSGLRDYFESLDKRDTNQLFRGSLYKRSKLFDARRSSSMLSRDAHLRRLAIKKSGNGYKRMEEFLASRLNDIMKENTFDFFVPKVADIGDRMKNGYYAGRGLSSVKEDISQMCRDAIKAKKRGDTGDINRIIKLFIRLAKSLEGSTKSSQDRDEMIRTWTENSPPGFCSVSSKYKKLSKVSERKYMNRSNGSSSINGGSDHGEYASDREIRRRLSKLNKKSMDSGSETSSDLDKSSEETQTDSESSASDTVSDLDLLRESRRDADYTADDGLDSQADDREWGARMTKASLVPPVTRKYEVIDHYVIVADHEEVQRKMRVSLPEDYDEKLNAQKNGTEESDMEIPEVKDYKPRKLVGDEVIEQEVYGIDPYTHNLLLDSMPHESDWPLMDKRLFIEDVLLRSLNRQARNLTGTGNTPMMYPLRPVIEGILKTAVEDLDTRTVKVCQFILNAIDSRPEDNYVAYRKGLGVVCNKEGGFDNDDFVVEFLGEVYPAWKWFEKQDGIRSLQKNSKDPAPEFYNIYLERPKGDRDGYDLVVVDAMHKANYASRICHSCRPNCEAKVTAVDGHYQIGIYAVRPIGYGEEVTFDYNSVTESKEEYEASVCLCGSQVCRGSYLNLTGEGAFQKVLKECHGILDRHRLMLEACELNSVSEDDYIELGRAGLGSCLLGGLPDWLIAYSSRLVRYINFERTKLPEVILRHNLEEKRKYFSDICLDGEKNDAEVQAEGVYNQRLQNLALTLDKVRYVMRRVFIDPKKAPPPLERLSPEETVTFIWKGEGSLVEELIQCMSPHMGDSILNELKSNIRAHDPSVSGDTQRELRKSLLWLRDEVRNLPCNYKCRHDAAADLIHIYAYTKCFFRIRKYEAITSPPVHISPLDLGPKFTEKLGSGFHKYCKTYGENYCLGQLIYWHNQTNAEPDCSLARASRGCLSLPEFGSFYAKVQKPSRQRVYGPRTLKFMLARMEKQPQRAWPTDRIWTFEESPKVIGSPMLDAVLYKSPLEKEMVHWLKHRPPVFQAMWDR